MVVIQSDAVQSIARFYPFGFLYLLWNITDIRFPLTKLSPILAKIYFTLYHGNTERTSRKTPQKVLQNHMDLWQIKDWALNWQ